MAARRAPPSPCLHLPAGTSLGLALIMYGREEGAETLIEQMTRDLDPIIRYGEHGKHATACPGAVCYCLLVIGAAARSCSGAAEGMVCVCFVLRR